MKIFLGEVKTVVLSDSDARAEEIARTVAGALGNLGGSIDVGRNFGDLPAILIVKLPDDVEVEPGVLLGASVKEVDFHLVHAAAVQAVEDQGIRE